MKKIYSFILLFVFTLTSFAQSVDFQKAVAKFRGTSYVTASVIRVDHKAAVSDDDRASGTMTIESPDKMNISVLEGKEQLDMNGDDFTMVMRGREYKANSKKNNQFVAFQAVLTAIIKGDGKGLTDVPGVELSQSGNIITINMDPTVGQTKKKRMMFSSFVITLDCKKGEILTLRMNGRGKNYTEYSFSDFTFKR